MTLEIKWDPSVRSMDDSIQKFFPAILAGAGKAVVGAAKLGAKTVNAAAKGVGKVAGAVGRTVNAVGDAASGAVNAVGDAASGGGNEGAITVAQEKVGQKKKELATAEQEAEALSNQPSAAAEAPVEAEPMPTSATAGKEIGGLDGNEGESSPTEQPGTELPPAPISTSLREDFGMDAPEIIDLLIKGGPESEKFVPIILQRLRGEQLAVLKSFDWFNESDWGCVRLHDNDYAMLSKYADRLELPLRQTMAAARRAKDEDEMADIWKGWHNRLDAEHRLSSRERNILKGSLEVIQKNGDMNAQTITSYGVNGTAAEIASLIKSYGYLYDVKVVGRGRKSDDRSYYYGTTNPPIHLKKIDSFIGNLWELGGNLDLNTTQGPRLFLPFESKRGEDYTVLLKGALDTEDIVWEGNGFVFKSYHSTVRAAEAAIPYLDSRKTSAAILLTSLDEEHPLHKQARDLVRLSCADSQGQVEIRKELNLTDEGWLEMQEEVTNGY